MSSSLPASASFRVLFGRAKPAVPTECELPASAEPTTEELLKAVQEKDREAFALLFGRYSRLVVSIGNKVLGTEAEAEDLVQDVFLFLWSKSRLFVPCDRYPAHDWVVRVIYHRAFDRRRYLMTRLYYYRANGESEKRLDAAAAGTSRADWLTDQNHRRSVLESAFKALTERQRRVLILHFYEGFSLREISAQVGEDYGNVRNHLYRGIDRLREYVRITDCDID